MIPSKSDLVLKQLHSCELVVASCRVSLIQQATTYGALRTRNHNTILKSFCGLILIIFGLIITLRILVEGH